MDDKLIVDNTDFLLKFTLENLDILKKLKTKLDQEVVNLYDLASQKKQSVQHLLVKSKHNHSKIKSRSEFENLIQHALLEKYVEGILTRFEFRIDTIARQYNPKEKFVNVVNPAEVNAKNLYVKIKDPQRYSTKEMLELQELLKEVNAPLVGLVKQYNENLAQINASKVLVEKITLEEIINEYIDFFLLDDEG
ncbi:hypothetical protein [Spiroplasma sp. SV19]|uniref:hypothetical protein n=1 Tax=Spiroplasma sp. SV19 TaxID=2570468 RepID=UPI0024B6EA52|nr:hypothetical protein [Spiroplasma sp. SV19]WHQ36467.1 hypothetical protein E7Y35_00735 [Spiroplasma sp. SV19]